jgi:3-oxoacyl-[acyl-carrier protein] reductase
MNELKDKIAIITGGSGDIGAAAVFKFVEEGARSIIIADLDIDKALKIRSKIQSESSCNCIAVKTDVSNYKDIKKLFKTTIDAFGTLDILVNCAGICPIASLEEIGEKQWDVVMAINLKSTYLCSREAVAIMKEKKSGKIINISSIAGRMGGIVTGINYAASKGAIITLTRSLAKICGPYNINVNCLAPGMIDNEMTKGWDNSWKEKILKDIPLGRFGTSEDVANAIIFLASEKSSYINGAIIDLNGGMYSG